MESVASNSSAPPQHHHQHTRFKLISDRILRALRHQLQLLHRSDSTFYILGATGNVYTVNLSATPSCTCPDRTKPCKHILFVFIRVLGVSPDDVRLRRQTLRPCQLHHLLSTPMLPEAMAGAALRERFHEVVLGGRQGGDSLTLRPNPSVEIEEGTRCPVCLEEMGNKEEKVVACGTCKNPIHEECLLSWKRIRGRRWATCVICRARWRNRKQQDLYFNLFAYVGQQHMAEPSGGSCTG